MKRADKAASQLLNEEDIEDVEENEYDSAYGEAEELIVSKKAGTREGSRNYSYIDIAKFLDLVDQFEPIGSNGCAKVFRHYNMYGRSNDRPFRRQASLKKKFDRLLYVQKKTGDLSCPPLVRPAKKIQKEILSKIESENFSSKVEDDEIELFAQPGKTGSASDVKAKSSSSGKRVLPNRSEPEAKRCELDLGANLNRMTQTLADIAAASLQTETIHEDIERSHQDIERRLVEMIGSIEKKQQELEGKLSSTVSDTLREIFGRSQRAARQQR
ncbi:hypothetical protein FGB62_38g213 [Gracilaria domingensis]|nr:hypothetical protein FGB62_38g213 [Gracilaria domingensis]